MAYKYQPIKDEILVSDNEDTGSSSTHEEEEENVDDAEFVGVDPAEEKQFNKSNIAISSSDDVGEMAVTGEQEVVLPQETTAHHQHDTVGQVIEQDGVLILETTEVHSIPEGSTVIAGSSLVDATELIEQASLLEDDELGMDESTTVLETVNHPLKTQPEQPELEDCHLCGKKVEQLDKHILANHGEKVECQLCNQFFPVGNLRWHILKEHCHNKVTECSLCDQKFVTKNALKNHIKQVHLAETTTCHICHKEYKDLYHHVKFFHDRIRNFECSYCEKKFQAKKLLYNHVQSIHLGEKTRCPECNKDISVDNFSRHVRETHEKAKKPCPHCDKEFAMSNLSRHIRQVHNNESTECPDCGKALTISNLNKHIKAVHKRLKKMCEICNEEVPYSSISVHKRKVHGIGKAIDDVTPRGPNLKLRKRYRQMIDNELEFDRLTEAVATDTHNTRYKQQKTASYPHESGDQEMIDGDLAESIFTGDEDSMASVDTHHNLGTKVIQVGDKNFTFSFAP